MTPLSTDDSASAQGLDPSRPWLRLVSQPWVHLALLSAFTFAILLYYGPAELPYRGDRSYFAYLGQTILRGDSIYRVSFLAYPPLGPMLGAGSMWLGQAIGVPSYLAPRYLGLLVGIANVVLLYLVARRATGNGWAALVGGLTLAGSRFFGPFVVTGLEPRMLIALFVLIGCLSLQRRRWWGAGLGAGLAGACWQPAGVLVALSFAATLCAVRRKRTCFAGFLAGIAFALILPLLYLVLTDSWWDFWQRSILVSSSARIHPSVLSANWLRFLLSWEWAAWLVAAAGLAWFAVASLRLDPRASAGHWLDPKLGGLPLLTLAWLGLISLRFAGAPDLLLLLPSLGFWSAWLAGRLLALAARTAGSTGGKIASETVQRLAGSLLLMMAVANSVQSVLEYRPATTLRDQLELVQEVTASLGPADRVAAFEAEALLVLSERPSLAPFVRTHPIFMRSSHLIGADDCLHALERVLASEPALVVIYRWVRRRPCMARFEGLLAKADYEHRTLAMEFPDLPGLSDRRHPQHRVLRWHVYTRRDEPDRADHP